MVGDIVTVRTPWGSSYTERITKIVVNLDSPSDEPVTINVTVGTPRGLNIFHRDKTFDRRLKRLEPT